MRWCTVSTAVLLDLHRFSIRKCPENILNAGLQRTNQYSLSRVILLNTESCRFVVTIFNSYIHCEAGACLERILPATVSVHTGEIK